MPPRCGNPGNQSEGKEWVKSALLGLLLLAAAYLILYTVNPNLVNLELADLVSGECRDINNTTIISATL